MFLGASTCCTAADDTSGDGWRRVRSTATVTVSDRTGWTKTDFLQQQQRNLLALKNATMTKNGLGHQVDVKHRETATSARCHAFDDGDADRPAVEAADACERVRSIGAGSEGERPSSPSPTDATSCERADG